MKKERTIFLRRLKRKQVRRFERKKHAVIAKFAAKGKSDPDKDLCDLFNKATNDGRDMKKISKLLDDSIGSIIETKDEGDIDSFFGGGQTTFLSGGFSGKDDFELICFMVVV